MAEIENIVEMFRDQLFRKFEAWVEKNKDAILKLKAGDRWLKRIEKELRIIKQDNSLVGTLTAAFWMFNIVTNLGIFAGVRPAEYTIVSIPEYFDKRATEELLMAISNCITLQFLRTNK